MSLARTRRQGFADQHLVVLPDPIRRTALLHPLLRGLLVTDAGYFPRAEGHRVERPQGSATHLLIACLQGRGWVRGADEPEPVAAGDLLWLAADTPHAYGAAAQEPWTIVWAHFTGETLPAWRAELGWALKGPVARTQVAPERIPELGLDQVYDCLEHGYANSNLLEAGTALGNTFCKLLRMGLGDTTTRSSAERIERVRAEIAAKPARQHRLPELAASAGLSVPHFSLLFRRQTGYAPIDYLIRQRIRLACRLLDSSEEGVAQIAAKVGFPDPYYFSRCFRRVMDCPPVEYRRRVKA